MRNASDHQDEMRSMERKGNRNTHDISSIRGVTGNFHIVVM